MSADLDIKKTVQMIILLYLFFIGSIAGWCIELVFRRFFGANNPEHRWINPGFLTGPYLPIYGFGLVTLYLLARTPVPAGGLIRQDLVHFLLMAVSMTVIEYIAGLFFVKAMHVRLWDYTKQWGNVQGIICPLFSFFWALLGAFYYFFIHPRILEALKWLSENMAFCLVIGFFYGVFSVDVFYSFSLINRIRSFAEENGIIVRYEAIKSGIRKVEEDSKKLHFLFAFRTNVPLHVHLEKYIELMTAFNADYLPEPIRRRVKK